VSHPNNEDGYDNILINLECPELRNMWTPHCTYEGSCKFPMEECRKEAGVRK